jgi:hypothetical protein
MGLRWIRVARLGLDSRAKVCDSPSPGAPASRDGRRATAQAGIRFCFRVDPGFDRTRRPLDWASAGNENLENPWRCRAWRCLNQAGADSDSAAELVGARSAAMGVRLRHWSLALLAHIQPTRIRRTMRAAPPRGATLRAVRTARRALPAVQAGSTANAVRLRCFKQPPT